MTTCEWIPIARQAPPKGEPVLVFYLASEHYDYAPMIAVGKVISEPDSKERRVSWYICGATPSRVTHWAPLPPPPED